MPILLPLLLLLAFVTTRPIAAQTAADSAAIRTAALDYVHGWYDGDAERMRRSLHPSLVKRIPEANALGQMGADELVSMTASGGGRNTPAERRVANVEVKDIFGDIAMVRAEMSGWVDYMQLARVGDRWQIVNVLWQLKERANAQRR